MIDLDFDTFFTFAPTIGTRGHRDKLYPQRRNTTRCISFFAHRIVPVWNSLKNRSCEAATFLKYTYNPDRIGYFPDVFFFFFCMFIQSITRPIFDEFSHGLQQTCWGCTTDVPFGGLASFGARRAPSRGVARFKDK